MITPINLAKAKRAYLPKAQMPRNDRLFNNEILLFGMESEQARDETTKSAFFELNQLEHTMQLHALYVLRAYLTALFI